MPLFGSSHNDTTARTRTSTSPTRNGTLHKGRDYETHSSTSPTSPTRKKGLFSRDRTSGSTSSLSSNEDRASYRTGHSTTTSSTGTGGFFGLGRSNKHLLDEDPSIRNARQTVADAEQAERDADRALVEARNRVRLAREHVDIVEKEAVEDARRAKAKQAEAKVIGKSIKGLGRHGH